MSTIQDLFQQAQLAEAAYADFLNPNISVRQALQNEGMSASQAADFLTRWQVVSQFSESGLLSNGFSATLFERLNANQQPTGQYTFASRGTDEFRDLAGADLDLAATGLAFNQIVSMVNYVLRLKVGANGLTQQLLSIR